MGAAAREVNQDAFWLVHNFLFTGEGQSVANPNKKGVQLKNKATSEREEL